MKKNFGPTQILILVGLLILILAPRPIAGALDLKSAERFDAAGNAADAAQAYATAASADPMDAMVVGTSRDDGNG